MVSKWQMAGGLVGQDPRIRRKSWIGSGKRSRISYPRENRWEHRENPPPNKLNIKGYKDCGSHFDTSRVVWELLVHRITRTTNSYKSPYLRTICAFIWKYRKSTSHLQTVLYIKWPQLMCNIVELFVKDFLVFMKDSC